MRVVAPKWNEPSRLSLMTKGIAVLLGIWGFVVLQAILNPWIGFVGYAGFATLCPQWNWRWGLPKLDYQKYLAAATVLGLVTTGFRTQRLPQSAKLALAALLTYLTFVWISSFQTMSPVKSAIYLDISWKICLMGCIGVGLVDTPKKLYWFLWTLVLCQGWNAYNINQLYYDRGINVRYFTWNYLDNNTYSISCLPIAASAFALLMTMKDWRLRALAGLIFVLQMHQIMILQSRGTMLGGLVLVALGVFFMPKNRTSITMISIGLGLGVMLAGPSVIEEFSSSFKAEGDLDTSAESRYFLWKAGAAIMADYPLLGVGPWAGEVMVPRYYEGDIGGLTAKALHNLFFEVGTGVGVIGLIAYLLFFGIPWVAHFQLWLKERETMEPWMRISNLSVLCGVPGYWAASMFSSGALIESPYLLVVLGCASLGMHFNHQTELESESEETEHEMESESSEEIAYAMHP
jgi:O-antigen ligase